MRVCGIVVEYNPFHNGHLYHLSQAKKLSHCDILIAVMSGNFVQRGQPAILDKWSRALVAIQQGVDLVIELPYSFVTQSAQQFATGAIQLLSLAQVDTLVFGSESNNLEELQEIASMAINPDHLKESLSSGMGFPKAYGLWAKEMMPNDILGVAYLKALQSTSIQPLTIQRTCGYHDAQIQGPVCSAKAIRLAVVQGENVADQTCMASMLQQPVVSLDLFYPYLRTLLFTLPKDYLQQIFLFSEGIENHLIQCAQNNSNWEEFLNQAVTRRYSRSRIQRTCLQLLCQVSKQEIQQLPPLDTLRPLAFTQTGQRYLKTLQQQEIKIASRFAMIPQGYRELEYKTTQLYTSVMKEEKKIELLKKEIGGPLIIK